MSRPALAKYEITRLPSGLTVATAQMPQMASVSVGIWVGVGARYEPPALNGAAHFIEHLLFKGTRKRNAREISQAVEGIGGYLNAFTTEEVTCFYSKGHAECLERLMEVLSDMFLNSTFAPDEVEKERNVIKEEVAMYLDHPQQHVHELLNEAMWPDQALGRPLAGTHATLDRLCREDLLAFRRENYVSSNTLVVAAGRVNHRKLLKLADKMTRRVPRGTPAKYEPAAVKHEVPRLVHVSKEMEQTQIALGTRTCSRHDERRYALRMLNTILGENMSSRLFQVVREDHGLAYSISSSLGFFADAGVLTVAAGLETDRLAKTLKLVMREMELLRTRLPGRAEVNRARDYLIGQMRLSLEGTENQMMWIGDLLLGHGRLYNANEVERRLHRVTPSEIRAVARDFLTPDRFTLALISPLKKAGHLERCLRA